MTFKPKHKELLNIPQVKKWYENMKARSDISADIWLRNLGLYCELNHTTPQGIIQAAKTKKLKDQFTNFVRDMEKKGRAGSYIVKFKHTLRSWLRYNDLDYKLDVNIANEDDNPTTMNESVPTKEELSRILRESTKRGRTAISLMAFSGLRPESIGNYQGNDGLLLGDIKDLVIKDNKVEFTNVPAMIVVRRNLSKARHQYFTFIGEEGVNFIKEYLEERISEGEMLSPESPLLQIKEGKFKTHSFMRTLLVTRDIREGIKKAGLKMRPYVLRAYFATALDIAESKGLISHPWRMFFMGHKGDIESRYSTNKGRLPPDMIEEMRNAYKKCLRFIETKEQGIPEEDLSKKLREFALMMFEAQFGIKLDDKRKEELYKMPIEDFQKELGKLTDEKKKEILNNGHTQKVVSMRDVESFIEKGWEFVSPLSTNKAIIRLPEKL